MKKIFLVAVIALFSLTACVPAFLGGGEEEAPVAEAVDINATVDAEASTQAVQTLDALSTPTLAPTETQIPTDAPIATATETLSATEEVTATPTEEVGDTPEAEAETTSTPDGTTPEASTETPAEVTATVTPEMTNTPAPTSTSVYPSPTSPVAINLPPENLVPYHPIEVKNTTKGKVYISLQGATEYDYRPVIEYDIPRLTTVRYRIPDGYYKIVVYVGKEPMIDYVQVNKNTSLRIVIRKDELKIEK